MTAVLKSFPPTSNVVSSAGLQEPAVGLAGRWEGNLGKGVLVLLLRSDGTAAINLKRRVRTVFHPCTWHVTGATIHLRCTRNQSLTFPIRSLAEDTLVLCVGVETTDTCLLHRDAFPEKPVQVGT